MDRGQTSNGASRATRSLTVIKIRLDRGKIHKLADRGEIQSLAAIQR
jgi:hypothetical protein